MEKELFDQPWGKFRIVEFYYNCSSEDYLEHYIEIGFQNGKEFQKLRFEGPKQLLIEEGFPYPTSGLQIVDISDRQLESVNVSVMDVESSWGAIRFLAKSVKRIQ